ncbi:MAG: OsmC family protein [Saprospiraceae bacterium]|nr:OsmC family protein [Saprospiraceae bacterium]
MKTSTVYYQGDIRTQCTHLRSGQIIQTDGPIDNYGKGEAFSPTDLVSTALGACMLSIMGIAAKTHEIDMDGTKAEVLKIMAENPRRIARIEIDIYMPAQHYTDKQKAILTHAAESCPVGRSLHPAVEQALVIHW